MTREKFNAEIDRKLAVQRQLQEDQLRILSAVDGLLQVTRDNRQRSVENRDYLSRLTDLVTSDRTQFDHLAEVTTEICAETAQLKRAVDYLLGKYRGNFDEG